MLTLDALFRRGAVIDPTFSLWTAHLQLTAADLGVNPTDNVMRALSFGVHRLAPKESLEEMRRIITAAKTRIEFYTLPFEMVRGARYLPEANTETLRGELAELILQFNGAADRFCFMEYQGIRERQFPIIESAMYEAARTPEAARAAVDRIRAQYPTAENIRAKCGIKYVLYALRGAANLEAAEAAEAEAGKVRELIQGMMADLYREVSERIGALIDIVKKGGTIRSTTVSACDDLIKRIDGCNIFGDRILSEMTARLARGLAAAQLLDKGNKAEADGIIGNLETMERTLRDGFAEAVREAENNLTAAGRRVLDIPRAAEG